MNHASTLSSIYCLHYIHISVCAMKSHQFRQTLVYCTLNHVTHTWKCLLEKIIPMNTRKSCNACQNYPGAPPCLFTVRYTAYILWSWYYSTVGKNAAPPIGIIKSYNLNSCAVEYGLFKLCDNGYFCYWNTASMSNNSLVHMEYAMGIFWNMYCKVDGEIH